MTFSPEEIANMGKEVDEDMIDENDLALDTEKHHMKRGHSNHESSSDSDTEDGE